MYKPLFLGINSATTGEWLFGLGILIVLVVVAGIIIYYTGYYIVKLFHQLLKKRMNK